MPGCSCWIAGIIDTGIAGLFSEARRGRAGLQSQFGQIGQRNSASAQRTETKVSSIIRSFHLNLISFHLKFGLFSHFLFALWRREQWPMFSTYSCWQLLVNQTKSLSKDHATLSEIYTTHLVSRLQTVIEDVQRIYKKCREIGYETHEEILRVLHELHTTMKTYHSYQVNDWSSPLAVRVFEFWFWHFLLLAERM